MGDLMQPSSPSASADATEAKPTVSTATLAEQLVKFGTAIGLLSLGAAFLYDLIFWMTLDWRVLSYLVLADHIETAVKVVGLLLLLATLFAALLAVTSLAEERLVRRGWSGKMATTVAMAGVMVAFIAAAFLPLFFVPGTYRHQIWLVAAAMLLALAMVHASRLNRLPSLVSRRLPEYFLRWGLSAALMTAFMAILEANRYISPVSGRTVDLVTVDGGKPKSAHVIRLVDRGLILRDSDGRIVFLPKETLRRVDLNVRASEAGK
jgi:hypothetical protein